MNTLMRWIVVLALVAKAVSYVSASASLVDVDTA